MENPTESGTEAKILAAAEEVFTRDGFDGARMQVIAETAGINKALLHYYFRSKQKLFEQVLYSRLQQFLPEINASFSSGASVYQRIEAFLDTYHKGLLENPQLPLFVLFSVHRNPEFIKQLPRTVFENVTGFFKQEIAAGRMKPVDPAHFFMSILGMCMFPFLARPMASHMMKKNDKEYNAFLSQRKEHILQLVKEICIV